MKKALYTTIALLIIGLAGVAVMNEDAHAQASWYDSDWQYRQAVTIDSSQVDSDLSDFPVYVDLSNLGSSFFGNTSNGCGDIRVTESDGTTEVPREVVACDTASSTGELHFKASTISSSSDTEFYIYYGNSSASDYTETATHGAQNVWTNAYEYVSHDGGANDSTANAITAAANGGVTSGGIAGAIGDATQYDAQDDYFDLGSPAALDFTSSVTISAFVNLDTTSSDQFPIFAKGDSQYALKYKGNENAWQFFVNDGDWNSVNSNDSPSTNTWVHLIGRYNSATGNVKLWVDGTKQTDSNTSGDPTSNSFNVNVGRNSESSGRFWDGGSDELRAQSTSRSDAWNKAESTNLISPTSFYTISNQEEQGETTGQMTSTNYAVSRDSLNVGGLDTSTSSNYAIKDTVGEQATGESSSANYQVQAGYRQMSQSSIAISSQQGVNLGSFGGVSGGGSEATPSMQVTTDNEAGYEMSVRAGSDPALQNTTAGGSFADYNAGTEPDYSFSVSASESAFGFSPEGANVTQQFLDNGSSCNTGSQNNTGTCWRGFSTSNTTIAQSSDNNQPSGATTTLRLRAESGADNIQTAGTYEATITVTAVAI